MQVEQEWYLYRRTQSILHMVRLRSMQSQRGLTTQELMKLIEMEITHGTR